MIVFSLLLAISLCIDAVSVYLYRIQYFHLPQFILCHLIALIFVLLTYFIIRQVFQLTSKKIILLFALVAFFLPFLGIIACWLFYVWMINAQKVYYRPIIHDYELTKTVEPINTRYGVGGLRVNLKSAKMPLPKRTDALLSMSTMSPERINNLIRTVLPDKEDEMRLLAFNLLKGQQRKILPQLNHAIEMLKNEKNETQKAKLYKWLAQQYWEVVYRNLIEKELMPYALAQVSHYTVLALESYPTDPSLHVLMGRIHLRKNNINEAIADFERAIQYGMSEERIILYLAEASFKQKEYFKIRKLFQNMHTSLSVLVSKRLMMFWSKKS